MKNNREIAFEVLKSHTQHIHAFTAITKDENITKLRTAIIDAMVEYGQAIQKNEAL